MSANMACDDLSYKVQPNGLLMTKYQRGRLKKLKKRASNSGVCNVDLDPSIRAGRKRKKESHSVVSSNSVSGLTSWEDIVELEHLLQLDQREKSTSGEKKDDSGALFLQNFYGPSIHLIKSIEHKTEQTCTGSDHRDLILSLLFHNGSERPRERTADGKHVEIMRKENTKENYVTESKKNSKYIDVDNGSGDESSYESVTANRERLQAWTANRLPPIPSWARVHNPAHATHLAVIEFSIDFADESVFSDDRNHLTDQKSWLARFIESNSVYKDLCSPSGLCGRQALPLHTKLFEGDYPKRASDVIGRVDQGRFMSPLNDQPPRVLGNTSSLQQAGVNIASSDIKDTPQELHKRFEVLLLSPQLMISEGYPTAPSKATDFTSNSSNSSLISDLGKISESLHHLIDLTISPSSDAPIIDNSTALPFAPKRAKEIIAMLESSLSKDGGQLSPLIEPLYLSTFLIRQDNASPKIYAMDCEMVKTTQGRELARVTLIRLDQQKSCDNAACHYTTVLDMLVKPPNQIVDFVTEYSGITAKLLAGISTSLQEVQVALLGLIFKEDIIVGHSLENDLHALHLAHLRVIDTSIIFRTDGRKHALRHLTLVLLKRGIQNSTTGHCSIEDAAAALELALRRAQQGSGFKLHSRSRRQMHVMELIDAVRKRHGEDQGFAITREKGTLVCIGSSNWIKNCVSARCSAHTLICEDISCSTRNSVCAWLQSDRRRPSFLLASLTVKENKQTNLIGELLSQIAQAAPKTTLILIVFQRGYEEARLLTEQRKISNNPKVTLRWDDEREVKWRSAIEESRNCEALWIGSK